MQAGTIAVLDEPVDEPLESFQSGSTALDVRDTQEYLDGARVQHGLAANRVESTHEQIEVMTGGNIEVEHVDDVTRVATEWIADVTDAGFVAAASTAGQTPVFPFDVIRSQTHQDVTRVRLDPTRFVESREDIDLWFSGSKAETDSDLEPNDVQMGYGRDANPTGGNVGVGFETSWQGTVARGVLYESGYVATYNSGWGPMQFAQFVRDAVLPVAEVPEPDEGGEQATLDESGGDECVDCGRETDVNSAGLCVVCQDKAEEQGGEA